MDDRTGLYIHIPFCLQKCAYCDFNSYPGQESLYGPYLRALHAEMAFYAPLICQTLYIGGGTPTVLLTDALCTLIREARDTFSLPDDAEITVEANPGTVDEATLRDLVAAGVNRLSLGVQSLNPHMLRTLGRIHDAAQARQAVSDARAAGVKNLNLDLMFGLPEQTLAAWQADLEDALALKPDHLSLYALTVEEDTPLAASIDCGALPAPDPDLAAEMYDWAEARLYRAGWEHYEISNWARSGYACRHNLVYWRNAPYLGLGAGAHSSFPSTKRAEPLTTDKNRPHPSPCTWQRWANLPGPGDYIAALENGQRPTDTEETIDRPLEMAETMIMGLRLLEEGIPSDRFQQRFGVSLDEAYGRRIQGLIERGLIERLPDRLRLTEQGHLLGNQVFVEFL